MRTYIAGYYCRDDLHLQLMNKDSNRKILEALRDAYPEGLTVEQIANKTKLPLKTIYAQKAELYREYYINHLEEEKETKRGRPAATTRTKEEEHRKRVRLIIEEASGVHDPYEGKKPVPLPPGNIVYEQGFTNAWHKIVGKEEEDELCNSLLKFIARVFDRLLPSGYGNDEKEEIDKVRTLKRWVPEKTIEFCCSQCGLNHEARDFIRAMLTHAIDKLDRHDRFINFLKDNQFLTSEAYDRIQERKEGDQSSKGF